MVGLARTAFGSHYLAEDKPGLRPPLLEEVEQTIQMLVRTNAAIFSLASGVSRCQDATSSSRAISVQTVCRQGGVV